MVLEAGIPKVKRSHLVGTLLSPQSYWQHWASDGKRHITESGQTSPEASEVAQNLKAFATQPDDPSSVPRTYMVQGEK